MAGLAATGVALLRATRLAARGHELEHARWTEAVRRVSAHFGLRRRVRVIASRAVTTPLAGGVVRPTVYVPADAPSWTDERRDIVLAHEIAHLASRDPLRNLISRVACALYWFHPLVWLARRQSIADCERACDEAVLASGVRPSTYARVLLDFAEVAPLHTPSAVVAMVRRTAGPLETRVMAILTSSPRRTLARRTVLPVIGAVFLTLLVAAAQPTANHTAGAAPSPTAAPTAAPDPSPATVPAAAPAADPRASAIESSSGSEGETAAVSQDCWNAAASYRSFSFHQTRSNGTIRHMVGRSGDDYLIQTSHDDVFVCMVARRFTGDQDARPSQWAGGSDHVVLGTRHDGEARHMEITNGRITWTVNGEARALDEATAQWRADLLAALDAEWDLSLLRGRVSTLRGEISTIRGERSTLLGEISTARGELSTMLGRISTARGEESTLRGEISTIRGHVSTLNGQISTERGAISTLRAQRWDGPYDRDEIRARIRRHEDNITRIEGEIERFDAPSRIREVEQRLARLDTEGTVTAIQRQIRDYDLENREAAIRQRIDALDVERRVDLIESEIRALDADSRSAALEAARTAAFARLRATLRR